MRIAAIGTPNRIKELKQKISSNHEFIEVKNKNFKDVDVVFDLNFDERPSRVHDYIHLKNIPVVVCSVKRQIESIIKEYSVVPSCVFIGMNCLPTFINRDIVEACVINDSQKVLGEQVFNALNWKVTWVESRVGMVTPRVIFMIINEAYYTVQEGTASQADIDIGMKLGTAYPLGPFEWAEKIGIKNIYEVLKAMYNDTNDGRYKVCSALQTDYYAYSITL